MAAKQQIIDAIALTEKKVDMALDDIIKMSKTNSTKRKNQRVPNRSQKFINKVAQDKVSKVKRSMDERSFLRQGALAQRRSNFEGNQFPWATEAAVRKAALSPFRNRPYTQRAYNQNLVAAVNKPRVRVLVVRENAAKGGSFPVKKMLQQVNMAPKQRPQTLDSRFANIKEQRMRSLSRQNNVSRRNGGGQPIVPWSRGRLGN